MKSLLDRDLLKGNILDVIREYRERLEILERLVWESGSGEGGLAVAEGPDIDLVYAGGTAVIGRGGDTILLFDSAGAPVAEFAATSAGLTAALAAATSGDVVQLPAGTIAVAPAAVNFIIPDGVILRGEGIEKTIFTFALTATLTWVGFQVGSTWHTSRAGIYDIRFDVTISVSQLTHRVIRLYGGFAKNIKININIIDPASIHFVTGIDGVPYGEDYKAICAVENVEVNINLNNAAGSDSSKGINFSIGVDVANGLKHGRTYIIRNCTVTNYFVDVTSFGCPTFGNFSFYFVGTASNPDHHCKWVIENCNSYAQVDGWNTVETELFVEGWGFYCSNSILSNCNSFIYADVTGQEIYEVTGFYVWDSELIGCTSLLEVIGGNIGDPDWGFGAFMLSGNVKAVSCVGICTNTGTVIANGVYMEYDDTATLIGGQYSGTTYDLFVFDPDGYLSLNGVQYRHGMTSGNLIYLQGDRGAYSVEDYHATDIEAAALTRHLPAPPASGFSVISDGTNWIATDEGIALQSDLHDPITLDADAAVLLDLSTQEIGLDAQTANTVLAGPATGAANEPTFRALVLADLPLIHWGSMYQDDTGTTIAVSATDTDYIVTGMSQGILNGMTFDNTQELTILLAGVYKVDWSLSFAASAANQEFEGAVGVNGVRVASTSAHRLIATGTDTGNIGGTGLLVLAVNDLVQIVIRNETSTADMDIEHANLSLIYLGVDTTAENILLEDGDSLLLEDGSNMEEE